MKVFIVVLGFIKKAGSVTVRNQRILRQLMKNKSVQQRGYREGNHLTDTPLG